LNSVLFRPTRRHQIQRRLILMISCISVLTIAAFAATQPPSVGTQAPAFTLPSQSGSVSLSQFQGQWVVLYFYPKDMTSGCTMEAHNFQKDIAKYQQMNTVIVGVSVDSVDSHTNFCTKEGLSFKLLSDADHSVTSQYGSVMDYQGQSYAARNTFIIDPSGVIQKVYVRVNPMTHSSNVLADLAQLQTPASN